MRIRIFLVVLFSLISFSVDAKDKPCSNKEINPDVQLQNNGWLKIIDQYVEEFTPEEFYNGNEELIKSHKNSVKLGIAREKKRVLNVKIQFLRPCIATTEMEEFSKKHNPSGDPDALIPLTGEKGKCIAFIFEYYQTNQANKEERNEIIKKAVNQCPDFLELLTPGFRCDYRLKVFLTSFSPSKFKKYEYRTDGFFPKAPVIDVKNNRINYKEEMLPGETMWIKFYPGTATSWCVWVPK